MHAPDEFYKSGHFTNRIQDRVEVAYCNILNCSSKMNLQVFSLHRLNPVKEMGRVCASWKSHPNLEDQNSFGHMARKTLEVKFPTKIMKGFIWKR